MDTVIRTIQILGLISSIFLSGMNVSASHLTLPTLYTRPISISTPIFYEIYVRGAKTVVPLCIFSTLCSALVAYLSSSQRNQQLWAVAAVATFSQLPWTLLRMKGTIDRLNALAVNKVEQEKANKEDVVGLLRRWAWMNVIRGGLALLGGLAGLWAVIQQQV